MTESLVAYCGLDCAQCQAYIATRAGDRDLMAQVAASWSSDDYPVAVEDIPCEGCAQESGLLFKWCLDCAIRACCRERGYANCAYCDELPCDHVTAGPADMAERLIGMQRALRA